MTEIEVETLDGELNQLRQEVAWLRAGESDQPAPEGTWHTPAEWIHRWNRASADERIARVEQLIDDSAAARRCRMSDHAGELACLQRVSSSQMRARALHPSPADLVDADLAPLCPECIAPAPCKTRRILDGQE